MRVLSCLILITFSLLLVGCGNTRSLQTTDTGNIPEWFTNIPQNTNYLYAAKTATSQDYQLAIDKAVTDARSEIARQIEIKVEGLQKRFQEETGTNSDAQLLDQFTQANKTIVTTTLSGSTIAQQKQMKDGDLWRAYVLIEYPLFSTKDAYIKQIKNNELLYTRLRATQTFKELEEEVKNIESSTKQ